MAGEGGRGRRSGRTVAIVLVLCLLAPSLNSISLKGLSEKNNLIVSNLRTGSIFFNGKELKSQSESVLVALDQTNGVLEQNSQLVEVTANEAAWRRLDSVLHCGHNKMKLKAMGPGVTDLQLDMGDAHPLSLIHVPETCGYSVKQNSLGLVLVVPYDGCNVQQEDGSYVLMMRWRESAVKFTCPMSTSTPTPASTTPTPAHQPLKFPVPHGSKHLNRHKRDTDLPVYHPESPHYAAWYNYYMHMMALAYSDPYYQNYDTQVYYPSASQQMPGKLEVPYIYYYPVIQHFYGKTADEQKPNDPPQTTTAKPDETTTMMTTTSTTSTTTESTTTANPATTAKKGPKSFFPYDQKFYKSGLASKADSHPGFFYWRPGHWLHYST